MNQSLLCFLCLFVAQNMCRFAALFSFAYTTDVKPGPKNHCEQEKHRDQHDKTIPQLL